MKPASVAGVFEYRAPADRITSGVPSEGALGPHTLFEREADTKSLACRQALTAVELLDIIDGHLGAGYKRTIRVTSLTGAPQIVYVIAHDEASILVNRLEVDMDGAVLRHNAAFDMGDGSTWTEITDHDMLARYLRFIARRGGART